MATENSKSKIKEIHENLINSLIEGHVGYHPNTRTFDRWKGRFGKYCDQPVLLEGSVRDNFYYLEEKGKIYPGSYEVLLDIFTGDRHAKEKIEKAVEQIKNISKRGCSDNENRHLPLMFPSAVQVADSPVTCGNNTEEPRITMPANRMTTFFKIEVGITNEQHKTASRLILTIRDLIRDLQHISNGTSPIEKGYRIMHSGEDMETYFGTRVQDTKNKLVDILRSVCRDDIMRKSSIVLEILFELLRYLENTCGMSVCGIGWENSIVLAVETGTSIDKKNLKLEVKSLFQEVFSTIDQGDAVVNLVSFECLSSSDADSLIKKLNRRLI